MAAKTIQSNSELKKSLGAFYTPADVAKVVAFRTISAEFRTCDEPRVLDPACGDGQLLVAAWHELKARSHPTSLSDRFDLAVNCLFGADIDPAAAMAARRAVATAVAGREGTPEDCGRLAKQLSANICVSNLLLDETADSSSAFPHLKGDLFDVVLTNPPFVNRRRQSKLFTSDVLDFWSRRFQTARGAYDLFVLFIERAWELLRAGGRCGAITPNKIAILDYAKACRQLLSQSQIEWLIDVSRVPLFPTADVYPLLFGFQKPAGDPGSQDLNEQPVPVLLLTDRNQLATDALITDVCSTGASNEASNTKESPWCQVLRSQFDVNSWQLFTALDVESRVPTLVADAVADWHVGTPGFGAQRMAKLLRDRDDPAIQTSEQISFIVSGNIQPFDVVQTPMRFMKKRWHDPVIDGDHPKLSDRQQALFRQPKLVVAGMGRRLRVAWDDRGRALGVQVYAATNLRVPRHYLLAILNSSLLTQLFRQRFSGKRLADGYLSIHKSQLQQLPIRVFDPTCPLQSALVNLSQQRELAEHSDAGEIEAKIDEIVLQLYHVQADELTAWD